MKSKIKLYSAEWCGTCRMVKKILHDNDVEFECVDVDTHEKEAEELGINELPVLIAYRGEKEHSRWTPTCGDLISWTKMIEW